MSVTRAMRLALKRFSLATGLYGPARWLYLRLRPAQRAEFTREVALYQSLLPLDALCFDVGANVGEKAEVFLAAGARVVAFEPNLRVLPELRARCPGCQIVVAGLGAEPGSLLFYTRASHTESGFRPDWALSSPVLTTTQVPVTTLDAMIAAHGRPDYLKIDVEGWEVEVLRGLSSPVQLVSFEFHLSELPRARECLTHISVHGPVEVNVLRNNQTAFHLPTWLPLDRFLDWFPGDLPQAMGAKWWADIYVRSVTP